MSGRPHRVKRDTHETTLERARKRFRVGDKVRVRPSGEVGIVASTPFEGTGLPAHLYGVGFDGGVVRGVHPLLLVMVVAADEDHCN